MSDLFTTLTVVAAWSVLMLAMGYAVGRDRERATHETYIVPVLPDDDALDRLIVDGGSLRAARHEQRMRRIK